MKFKVKKNASKMIYVYMFDRQLACQWINSH